jgi:hypothetical protein
MDFSSGVKISTFSYCNVWTVGLCVSHGAQTVKINVCSQRVVIVAVAAAGVVVIIV